MNEIQILSTYNPFVVTGCVLTVVWILAYVCSWIVQFAWAWIDESKVASNNWIIKVFTPKGGYNYPDGWTLVNDYYKYHLYVRGNVLDRRDSKPAFNINDTPSNYVIEGSRDYGKKNKSVGTIPFYLLIMPLIWFSMLCLNFWYISMWFAMAYAVAFSARMARRGQKLLTKHIEDKDAHKE